MLVGMECPVSTGWRRRGGGKGVYCSEGGRKAQRGTNLRKEEGKEGDEERGGTKGIGGHTRVEAGGEAQEGV